MSKITLEDCAQEYDRRAGDSASGVTVNDYPGAAANHAKAAALIRAAQKVLDVVGTPIQYLPILDGNEFLSCAVCGDDWLRGEPEQHMPECALVELRKLEEGE